MKKIFIAVSTLIMMACLNNCIAQVKAKPIAAMPTGRDAITGHTIGKSLYATMIMEMWKDWDDNTFDKHDYMADSVIMFLPDGMVTKGKQENLEGAKKFRGSLTSAKSVIYSCVPLLSPDKKEDAVCIWGEEEDVFADGKIEKRGIHEVWWFNKAGKIIAMRQWVAKFGAP